MGSGDNGVDAGDNRSHGGDNRPDGGDKWTQGGDNDSLDIRYNKVSYELAYCVEEMVNCYSSFFAGTRESF